jgi:hypothetical protein
MVIAEAFTATGLGVWIGAQLQPITQLPAFLSVLFVMLIALALGKKAALAIKRIVGPSRVRACELFGGIIALCRRRAPARSCEHLLLHAKKLQKSKMQ